MPITVSDVRCSECRGGVTVFGIPDPIWKALGFAREWVCLNCVARSVNPKIKFPVTPTRLRREMVKRFGEGIESYCGVSVGGLDSGRDGKPYSATL